jgi:hypothetical protein
MDLTIGDKPSVNDDAKSIIDPKDIFSFFANLKAIPVYNQALTSGLVVIGGIVVIVNAIIGIHDEFVPQSMTWLYSQATSSDDSGPMEIALTGSGILGVGIWYMMKEQLRKYMKFHMSRQLPPMIRPGVDYAVKEFFSGRSRVPLSDATLRIVASNMECGQYRRRQGSTTRTVSFREPVRGVILFEKTVAAIPARVPVTDYFAVDTFRFDEMFEVLYPPNKVSESHGLDIHWEIQLLHPEFVDHELTGPTNIMPYHYFLKGGKNDDKPRQGGLTFEF